MMLESSVERERTIERGGASPKYNGSQTVRKHVQIMSIGDE